MRLTYILIFLCCVSILNAQQTPDGFMLNRQEGGTAIIPQSPEAARLGRYGNLPLNSSTGQMNFSLPIYSVDVDGNSWPVSLNYNFGGLIVEEKQSLFGLGWSLNSTGAVIREVRGLPDEAKYGYYSSHPIMDNSGRRPKDLVDQYMTLENDNDIDTKGFDAWNLFDLNNLLSGIYDSEPDKYTVSAGSLNFSFKLNDVIYNSEGKITSCGVYMLSKHANKVEVIWSTEFDTDSPNNSFVLGFVITDTNGVQYKFDVIEKVQPQGVNQDFDPKPISAWKLSQILYLNGQTVDFNYNFISQGEIQRQVLNSITFPKGTLIFVYQNFERKLCTEIRLYNKTSNTPVKTYTLGYDGPRDLLKVFTLNADEKYEMEYYFEDMMPPFINSNQDYPLARKRDYWKFYNGANNEWGLNLPTTNISGVNKSPNLNNTKIGALQRIIYPTKGSTNIYYEQNEIKTQNILDSDYYESLPIGRSVNLELDAATSDVASKQRTLEILYPTVATINHTVEGDRASGGIAISMSRADGQSNYTVFCSTCEDDIDCPKKRIPEYPSNDFYYDVAEHLRDTMIEYECLNTIPPMYPQLLEEFGYADIDNPEGGGTIDSVSENSDGKILIMPGIYNLEIFTQTLGANVRAELSIQLYGSQREPHPTAVNKRIGGIRVDYLKDCSDDSGESCFVTDYD